MTLENSKPVTLENPTLIPISTKLLIKFHIFRAETNLKQIDLNNINAYRRTNDAIKRLDKAQELSNLDKFSNKEYIDQINKLKIRATDVKKALAAKKIQNF